MKKKYYAAYGSNLNIEQMRYRCPDAKIVGTALLDGLELLFKGSRTGSYLTVEPSVKNQVPVGIWEVSSRDELNLDYYEGYPRFYYKESLKVPVKLENGEIETLEIFLYIIDETRELGLPTQSYFETCLEGYRDFGFDPDYLYKALERSDRNENKHRKKNLPTLPK